MLTLPELDALLQGNGVLLLPNQHGARLWQQSLGLWRCQQRGALVVEAAAIHAIDLWLAELWQTLTLHCAHPLLQNRVLDAAEETLLWQRLLEASPAAAALLNPGGSIRHLREAQRLLHFWQVPAAAVRQHLPADADDAEADQLLAWRWLQDFTRLCERQHCLPQSALLPALLQVLRDNAAAVQPLLPTRMLWLDFDDPPPVYQQLQDTLQQLGVLVTLQHVTPAQPEVSVQAHADSAAEIRAAAQWAKNLIDTTPEARVGIVCPNLQSLRPQLLRIFQQHIPPAQLYCSAAQTLADHPCVATALQLLTLHKQTVDSLLLCQLLRSPWLRAADQEADGRAALEWRIRRQGELQVTLATVRSWCMQQDQPCYSPVLGAALLQIQQLLRRGQLRAMPQWLDEFQAAWQVLLDFDLLADQSQRALREAWQQWLDAGRYLAALTGTLTREQAQSALALLAQHSRLGGGNAAARVHLLAPVETAGLRFTHVQVLQMQAGTWPSELHPNPCLPWRLQQQYQMPAVDPNRELARARQQMQRLQHNTAAVLRFSYPAQVDDLPVLPNPLLAGLPVTSAAPALLPASLHPALALFRGDELLTVQEITHLPLPAAPTCTAPGSLLTAQALCPFRAFALHRLHAQELPKVAYGLPASAVGELLHRVLQAFWQALGDSRLLASLSEAELAERLQQAVDDPLRQLAHKYPHTLTPRLRELERQRMTALLLAWLDHEKTRAPFSVVMSEQALQWHYRHLQVNVRIDRVDATANGRLVVDYKTGALATPCWQETRPQQPQLLLYQDALQQDAAEPLAGLLYAKVTLEKMGYDGITAQPEGFDKLAFDNRKGIAAPSWQALQQHWQDNLQALAQEYLDGLAVVAPQFRHSCNHCHLDSLCRIAEARRQQEEEA